MQDSRAVYYANKSLTDFTDTASRYCQTERETLGVVWTCEHYDMYVRGPPHFTVITDHKPLERIWQKERPRLRIEWWGLRLQPYNSLSCIVQAVKTLQITYPCIQLKQGRQAGRLLQTNTSRSTRKRQCQRQRPGMTSEKPHLKMTQS